MPDAALPAPGSLDALVTAHKTTLDAAVAATRDRGYWSAFAEAPSTKIWGEDAPAAGKAAFDSLLGKDFPLSTPGAVGTVAREAGLVEPGYRLLANTGGHDHQEVPHLHVHIFGGRQFREMIPAARG